MTLNSKAIHISNLEKLIEPNIYRNLSSEYYPVEVLSPEKLLHPNRFDLAFKLFYLRMVKFHPELACEVYLEHIRAFGLGRYFEAGRVDKTGQTAFINQFEEISQDIRNNGFDSERTIIPLSVNGVACNGAHRIASAIAANREICTVVTSEADPCFDYCFFQSRNVSTDLLDLAAREMVQCSQQSFIALVWPSAVGHEEEIVQLLGKVLYKKEVALNFNGAKNFLTQVYASERWIGTPEQDFSGAYGKQVECFQSKQPLRVFAFMADDVESTTVIKKKIRDIFGIGNSSIHTTDTHTEAVSLASLLFNDRAIHFLNYAKPNRFSSFRHQLLRYRTFLEREAIHPAAVVLDSGMVLAAYGLREADDIDFLYAANQQPSSMKDEGIENHEAELRYHSVDKLSLIYDPRYHFEFGGAKFVAYKQLYAMKKRRAGRKDKIDVSMMEALIEGKKLREYLTRFKHYLYYLRLKCRRYLVDLTKLIGLYAILKRYFAKPVRGGKS